MKHCVTEIEAAVLACLELGPANFSDVKVFVFRRLHQVAQHANGFRKVDRALQSLRKSGDISRSDGLWVREEETR